MSSGTGAGKGSRPRAVNIDTYAANYDLIFGKSKPDDIVPAVNDADVPELKVPRDADASSL